MEFFAALIAEFILCSLAGLLASWSAHNFGFMRGVWYHYALVVWLFGVIHRWSAKPFSKDSNEN